MLRVFILFIATMLPCIYASHSMAAPAKVTFKFDSITSLEEMSAYIREHFPLGSLQTHVRQAFVVDGGATLKKHPLNLGVEKYIYDINLCNYYIWRWNISADYDANGKLEQAYINGNAIFPKGRPQQVVSKKAEPGKKASIYRAQRPRPEAYKGEASLGYILFDRDSDPKTINDQAVIGTGPNRADPVNMGKMVVYTDVEPWRSIFDNDNADYISSYRGDCTAVNKRANKDGNAY